MESSSEDELPRPGDEDGEDRADGGDGGGGGDAGKAGLAAGLRRDEAVVRRDGERAPEFVDPTTEDTKLPLAEAESSWTDGLLNERAYVNGAAGGVLEAGAVFLPLAMYVLSLKISWAGARRRNPSFAKLL